MTTKEYLNQARVIERRINIKLSELFRLRTLVTSVSANCDSERVQTSMGSGKIENAMVKIVDIEKEVEKSVEELSSKRKIIEKQILLLENDEQANVLYGYYIGILTQEQIADDMNYSLRTIKNLMKKGTEDFENTYGKLYLGKKTAVLR